MVLKTEPSDAPDLTGANGHGNGYLDDDDEDDERDQRRWMNRATAVPRTAGFVDHDLFSLSRSESRSSTTLTAGRAREHSQDWDRDARSQASDQTVRASANAPTRTQSYSDDSRSTSNRSPVQFERHRVPYFRYFGPTAIVPGFKQMVANVYRDNRRKSRGSSFSTTSPSSLLGHGNHHSHAGRRETASEALEDLPVYDVNSLAPVHPLITNLVEIFFQHLGCNYLFLQKDRFLRLLKDKRVEAILVDAVCALAARFLDQPVLTHDDSSKMKRSEYGHLFAQRAKAAIVDTFPCPSVAAVQACLLMAYEGFGADQDSALWMYLGIAIRMAVDLGLQKREGIKYQGERDPWYTRYWSRKDGDGTDDPDDKDIDGDETPSHHEQQEVEQERIDTFWAVFVLDRVISSGTGRPVTFRDDDFELSLPPAIVDPETGWPAPFPPFIEIIHLYGRVSDVLNHIREPGDLTEDKMEKLRIMERDLTAIYQKQDHRLHFNAVNFRGYVQVNQGTTFILLHFWFHALVIILHQPTMLAPKMSPAQLLESADLPNSRELSMSSAKTIADILAFAELIDPKSLIGNPFTSQPIYIAACAFLTEMLANSSQPPSREPSPSPEARADHFRPPLGRHTSNHDMRPKHSLLASAASQNYSRCYKSLQQLEQYWGGVGYILTVLDQKSKGILDPETYSNEDFEATKRPSRGPLSRLPRFEHPSSPNVPPIAYSLTGTTNSPNSNLTVLFQNSLSSQPGASGSMSTVPGSSSSVPVSAATPPGNMIYDPIRQSLPETPPAFPPAYLQPNVSAVRYPSHASQSGRLSQSPAIGKSMLKFESPSPAGMDQNSPHNDPKPHLYGTMPRPNPAPPQHMAYNYGSQHHSAYDSVAHERSPSRSGTPTGSGMGLHNLDHGHNHNNNNDGHDGGIGHHPSHGSNGGYEAEFAQSGLVSGSYSYVDISPINDIITFNSQEVNFDMLGLQSEMMPPWLEILSGDVLGGLFEGGVMGASQHM